MKASDNGKPPLEGVCSLLVKIKDKNDNGPVFDRGSYNKKVPQDLPIGSEIIRVSASDVDEGENEGAAAKKKARSLTPAQLKISANKILRSKSKDRREGSQPKRLPYKLVPEE